MQKRMHVEKTSLLFDTYTLFNMDTEHDALDTGYPQKNAVWGSFVKSQGHTSRLATLVFLTLQISSSIVGVFLTFVVSLATFIVLIHVKRSRNVEIVSRFTVQKKATVFGSGFL